VSTLSWIIAVSLAGGLLSVCAAAALSVAALLGAAFLEIIPHALEHGNPHNLAATLLFGILAFFVLEKLVLWRHCHHDHCEAHDAQAPAHDHGRSGLLILVGDTFHNFVDGILIAAAFLQSTELGIVTSLAIIAHEIPQEVGDYLILLHSGYSKVRALVFNLLSSLATLVGAMLAYFALSQLTEWIPTLLGLGAASMIYVAVADLIPGLHKRTDLRATIQQVLLIGLGVGSIALVRALAGE
jgi:zinc and cadmium transporter